jgi:hypothetical protein
VVTLPDSLYRYRYHLNNATLVSGTRSMEQNYTHNGDALAAFYVVGAMRLWAGHSPETLRPMLAESSLKWNLQSLIGLSSAAWGSVSPGSLRLFLRGLIRSRDLLAGLRVEEGKPYEWRSE